MAKKILVTGGAGFIGSWLCEQLVKNEEEVICIDNLSTGNKANITNLLDKANFKFIQADVRDLKDDTIPQIKIDEIYDLASPASVTYITDYPIEAATINSMGLKNLLDLALKHQAKILFASSSEAYGDPKEHPQKETYWGNVNSVGVRSGYDEGKRFGEALCMAYKRQKGVNTRIVRIFNTYGPNSSPEDSRVIPRLVTQSLKGENLTVHGDGQQTRSFCYVLDMVNGIIKTMENEESNPINLGNPEEYKISDVAKKILDLTNSKSEIIFVPRPEDDPAVRRPDISKAKELLSWEPKTSFKEGLKLTIEYFKNLI